MTFELAPYLSELRGRIDHRMKELLAEPGDDDDLRLKQAIRGAVLDGGKRLRPCLTIAACEAVGGSIEDALTAACAVEMIHCYSLVHDDLPAMDDDDMRRGKPTIHKEYGEAAAILVGDALLTHAFEALALEGVSKPDAALAVVRASQELALGAGTPGMVGGQAIDIAIKDGKPSFEALERCHELKTAALFRTATTIGALVAQASDEHVEKMREFGFSVGLAFQHADDLRDNDFPEYRDRSLRRTTELAERAKEIAVGYGDAGLPLTAIANLIVHRAEEAIDHEVSTQD